MDDIAYGSIDIARVRDHPTLFYLVTSASFIESGSDLYAGNLARYFADRPETAHWLIHHWEHEELQHGRRCGATSRLSGPNSTGSAATRASSRNIP